MLEFPSIEPGGCLPLAWQLTNKRVVLVGGGQVAAGRLVNVLQADALVTLIAPSNRLHPEVNYRIHHDKWAKARITHLDRNYNGPQDLQDAAMVLTAIDDNDASIAIWRDAKTLNIPVNVADVPPNCDFYFGSLVRRGPLQIMVSTNGRGPKIASIIRHTIEDVLPQSIGVSIDKVGRLRELLRERAPGVGGKLGQRRMRWMTEVCETWSLEQLGELDESQMNDLLDRGWEKNQVPSYYEITNNSRFMSFRPSWKTEGIILFTVGIVTGFLITKRLIR